MLTGGLPFLFGLLAGALGGLMGVGGGIILVPLLVHALRAGQHEAQGTSLVFVTATAVVAALPYLRAGNFDLQLAAWLSVGAVPGVLLGAAFARRITARRLRRAFGVLILATAIRILASVPMHTAMGRTWGAPWNLLLGFAVGASGGLLGIGGGTLLVPVLVLGQRIPQHVAQGVSLLMILPAGIAGGWSHARHGHVLRHLLPPLMAGGAIGALIGGTLAHAIDAASLSRLFAIFLLPVSAQMIFGRRRGTVPARPPNQGGSAR